MAANSLFHPDFKAMPYWWEAYRPRAEDPVDVPAEARVAIVGAGYAGLSTALELARHGVDFGGAGSTGAGVRRQHAQRRLIQRWRQYR